jgi:DNA-binding MarR family transcriptional regulator
MKTLSHNKQINQYKYTVISNNVNKVNRNTLLNIYKDKYLTTAMYRILKTLLHEKIVGKRKFLYQDRLASLIDRTRSHTNRCLKDLEELNLIQVHNMGYNACEYYLHPLFYDRETQLQLSKFDDLKFLRIFFLIVLSFFNLSHGSTNVTPSPLIRSRYFLESIYTRENRDRGQHLAHFFNIKSKREAIKMILSPLNNKISANLGFSDYCSLQFISFADHVLISVYHYFLKKRKEIKNPALFMLKMCRIVCKAKNIKPNYSDMLLKVNAAGYSSGDRLLLSDPESQPRFEKNIKKEELKKEDLRPATNSFLSFLGPEIEQNIMRKING